MIRILTSVAVLAFLTIATGAFAETAPSATDKKAVSKACSDQANEKGLHGVARKKFRSECKKNGGKTT